MDIRGASKFSSAILLAIVIAGSARSGTIGVPVTAERQWALGGIVAIENADVKSANSVAAGDLKTAMFLAEAAYGFSHDVEFYLRLGISGDKLSQTAQSELNFHRKTAWGLGLRSLIYDSYGGWKTYIDVQYFTRLNREVGAVEVDIKEWQAGASLAYAAQYMEPYFGYSYGRIDMNSNNPSSFPSSTSRRKAGLHLGVSFPKMGHWKTFAEGRFLNGPALSLGIHRLF